MSADEINRLVEAYEEASEDVGYEEHHYRDELDVTNTDGYLDLCKKQSAARTALLSAIAALRAECDAAQAEVARLRESAQSLVDACQKRADDRVATIPWIEWYMLRAALESKT